MLFAAEGTFDTVTDWIGIPMALAAVVLLVAAEVRREQTGVLDRRLLRPGLALAAVVVVLVAVRFVIVPS